MGAVDFEKLITGDTCTHLDLKWYQGRQIIELQVRIMHQFANITSFFRLSFPSYVNCSQMRKDSGFDAFQKFFTSSAPKVVSSIPAPGHQFR